MSEVRTPFYNVYNNNYAGNNNGRDWHDASLKSVLTYLAYPSQGGMRLISRLNEYHSPTTTSDYADDIVAEFEAGRLVIVDQSTGDPDMNKADGERLMWRVFNRQREDFIHLRRDDAGAIVPPPDIIVYVEEAHNLLPAKEDLKNVWSRVAKEGSSFGSDLPMRPKSPVQYRQTFSKTPTIGL